MRGYKKCPKWLKLAYRKAVKYTCEQCIKHEEEVGTLTPHRIRSASKGGTYSPHNVKMVCNGCHEIFNSAQRISRGTQ